MGKKRCNKSYMRPSHNKTSPYNMSLSLVDDFKIIGDHFKVINDPKVII